jgi:hypothetical protein
MVSLTALVAGAGLLLAFTPGVTHLTGDHSVVATPIANEPITVANGYDLAGIVRRPSGTVSRVGGPVDRPVVSDYAAVSQRGAVDLQSQQPPIRGDEFFADALSELHDHRPGGRRNSGATPLPRLWVW